MSTASRRTVTLMLLLAPACATPGGGPIEPSGKYVYVWVGDAESPSGDYLAVLDIDSLSPSYGTIVANVSTGRSGGAHHVEHVMPEGDRLLVNAFRGGETFVINVGDPRAPRIETSFTNAGPYTFPHSFERTPTGNVLATFQNQGEGHETPGGLVELDSLGNLIRGSDAADPTDPDLRPYSLAILPEDDIVVTTTGDMQQSDLAPKSFQIWRLSDLSLLHTVILPPGPRGDENIDVAEPRVLEDGTTVIVTTFRCGMYRVEGLGTETPSARLIHAFPWESYEKSDTCALPVVMGRFWVQTVAPTHSLVVFDMSDPDRPLQVSELQLGDADVPHWISGEVGGDRIVLTGQGTLEHKVVLLRLDRETGALTLTAELTPEWPTGAPKPHGAVFSRP